MALRGTEISTLLIRIDSPFLPDMQGKDLET